MRRAHWRCRGGGKAESAGGMPGSAAFWARDGRRLPAFVAAAVLVGLFMVCLSPRSAFATAPDLTVFPTEDLVATRAVIPRAYSSDPSATFSATLNGAPFVLRRPVKTNGAYELVVTATDIDGHSTTITRHFTVSGVTRAAISDGYYHLVGLKAEGSVVATGYNDDGRCNVEAWSDIVAITAGWSSSFGVRSDGTVVRAGGQLGNLATWSNIVQVAAGVGDVVGLRSDGTATAVGSIEAQSVSGWSGIAAIAETFAHVVGLRADGSVVATGFSSYGQCNVSSWSDIIAIGAGHGHTVGLKPDGTVVAVGSNDSGQCDVSGWHDIVAVAAGGYMTAGLMANGTVVAAGNWQDRDLTYLSWSGITDVAVGGCLAAIKSDGTVLTNGLIDNNVLYEIHWDLDDPPPPVVTPASSYWSLGLFALAGLGTAALVGRRSQRANAN